MTTVTGKTAENLGKYLVVYFCIMALAGLQFIIAFQDLGARQMFHRMFVVALAEAGLAVLFFMHLWSEKRGFVLFVLLFTIFVLISMQFSWSDSFRLLHCGGYCS